MRKFFEGPLERTIFASRWLQAPLYVGLLVALVLYCFIFYVELIHLCERVFGLAPPHHAAAEHDHAAPGKEGEHAASHEKGQEKHGEETHAETPPKQGIHIGITEEELMLAVLGMVDVTMVANLIVMVVIGGYSTFCSKLDLGDETDRPDWLDHITATTLKIKLSVSLVTISGIHLLKAFINIDQKSDRELFWMVVVHMVFMVSAVFLTLADRWTAHPDKGDGHGDGSHGDAGHANAGHAEAGHGDAHGNHDKKH
jgi:uncharacterized protein (TIGR00645 family)